MPKKRNDSDANVSVDTVELKEAKVLLVGDGFSGKTSLLKRLLGLGFDRNEPVTRDINIRMHVLKSNGINMTARLWDFGGQEIMHATHQFFFTRRSFYILVLDGRKDEKTEYWLKLIRSFGGDSPVLVVLNKMDQNPSFDVNRTFLKSKYQNIMGFYRVSCCTKMGIEALSGALVKELTEKMPPVKWPKGWFNVKTALEKMGDNFIDYRTYEKMCLNENITGASIRETLLRYLNDLGVIIHFEELDLRDTHVLDPKWVTQAVYKIINSGELVEGNGLLNIRSLDKILKSKSREDYIYPKDKYRYIIAMMKKFELCYAVDDETVLIPDLLAVGEPLISFDYSGALAFIIQYDFLPRSVMPRFIVNTHADIKDNLQWRTGVALWNKDFHANAVVKADHEAKRIHIYVTGGQKRDYFAVLLNSLRRINQSFEKLKTTELVPMPDDGEITVNYKHLIRLEEEGIEYYLPGESEKKYKVKDLLGNIMGGKTEEDDTLQMLRTIKVNQLLRKPDNKDS